VTSITPASEAQDAPRPASYVVVAWQPTGPAEEAEAIDAAAKDALAPYRPVYPLPRLALVPVIDPVHLPVMYGALDYINRHVHTGKLDFLTSPVFPGGAGWGGWLTETLWAEINAVTGGSGTPAPPLSTAP
jgi:hypothetical protein